MIHRTWVGHPCPLAVTVFLALASAACGGDGGGGNADADVAAHDVGSADSGASDAADDTGDDVDGSLEDVDAVATDTGADAETSDVAPPGDVDASSDTPLDIDANDGTDTVETQFPPSFNTRWIAEGPSQMLSSPRLTQVDDDGVLDLILGYGIEKYEVDYEPNGVVAVSGATGDILWDRPTRYVPVGTAHFANLDGDDRDEVIIGGRNGELVALDVADGSEQWVWMPGEDPRAAGWFNFYNVVSVPDRNGDGVVDLIATNGGDGLALPSAPRTAGHVMLLSGADGQLLWVAETPDLQETYMSPILLDRPGGEGVLIGTGGETIAGALWFLPLAAFEAPAERATFELVARPSAKGVIAPPILADLNADGTDDVITATFNAELIASDGATFEPLWQIPSEFHETYSTPAIGFFDDDEVPDVLSLSMRGVYPVYSGGRLQVISGAAGSVIHEDETFGYFPWSSIVTADLDGGGRSDAIAYGSSFTGIDDRPNVGDIWVYHGETETFSLRGEIGGASLASPTIADLDGDGLLELLAVVHQGFAAGDPADSTWQVECRELNATASGPGVFSYLGLNGASRFPDELPRP